MPSWAPARPSHNALALERGECGMFTSLGASGPSPGPSLAAWGVEEKRGEEQKGRRTEGGWGGHFCSHFPSPALDASHQPSPEAPRRPAQVGGQRRSRTATWEPTRRRAEKEGRKEGWWEGAREEGRREGGGGEREERGRDRERRSNKEPRSWGWRGVQGRGGRSRGSGGTWGRAGGLGGRIVRPAPDLPG